VSTTVRGGFVEEPGASTTVSLSPSPGQTDPLLDANGKVIIDSTGALTAPIAGVATETARALAAEALLAPKASPTFAGTVHLPATAIVADQTFDAGTHGPVIVDQSDGHTYRIISTAGVLSTVQVS
jgi:hypothetical protein